jgi:L-amino acid N-acyltransferase YncA
MNNINYQSLTDEDLLIVKEIYEYYIQHSTATFHTENITVHELKDFIHINHPVYKSFLITYDDVVAGYCYISEFKKRQAYNRSAEVTIYLKPELCNKGIGVKALNFLEQEAKKVNIKNLLGVITADNYPSIKLFQKLGYFECAHFKNIGEKMNQVLDVVIYQKEI